MNRMKAMIVLSFIDFLSFFREKEIIGLEKAKWGKKRKNSWMEKRKRGGGGWLLLLPGKTQIFFEMNFLKN